MNAQAVGLRVASVLFGLGCLAALARLLARLHGYRGFRGYMHAGYHNVGYFPVLLAIALTAFLCVWLWRLSSIPPKAGPPQGS